MTDESTFLETYDPRKYEPVAVSVDVVVLTIKDGKLCVLALTRDTHPFRGKYCLPGTFVQPLASATDWRGLPEYAVTALAVKAHVYINHMEQLATFGAPDRDPRMHVVSVAYMAFAPNVPEPEAGWHVSEAQLIPVEDALSMEFATEWAFDHYNIVRTAVERARNKLEYTTLAIDFLPKEFTIPELKAVYEAVWGMPIDTGNFYRKVRSSKGFIEKLPRKRGNAQLYKVGEDMVLFPPIRRDAAMISFEGGS